MLTISPKVYTELLAQTFLEPRGTESITSTLWADWLVMSYPMSRLPEKEW